jgi:hypothetical protein
VFANGRHPSWSPDCAALAYDDGLTDFPEDRGCDGPTDVSERAETGSRFPCDDGVDNDANGLVDLDDPKCQNPNSPYWEQTPACGLGA